MSSFPPSAIGALLLIVAFAFYARKLAPKITAAAGFVGVVLLGTTGLIGRILTDVTGWVNSFGGHIAATVFGSAAVLGIGVTLFFGIHFIHDLHPKRGRARATTLWYGIALGAMVVAGATGIPALNGLHQAIASATTW